MKTFNTTAICVPSQHYMVDISECVSQMKKMIDRGEYFTINRARQYGKTTVLAGIESRLKNDYYVVSMDFQNYGEDSFRSEDTFCRDFAIDYCDNLLECMESESSPMKSVTDELLSVCDNTERPMRFFLLFRYIKKTWDAADKPVILIIDEVDSATNNQVFIDFFSQLRTHYIKREKKSTYKTFQSVILAGVTDVKHLKGKIRDEDQHKVNSPWNIAADFNIDMSLAEAGIKEMLEEYEGDHDTGMDTGEMAKLIRSYTNGYPFLVSRICQLIDEEIVSHKGKSAWTRDGFNEAIKLLLAEKNTLFESLTGKLSNYPELREVIRRMLLEGIRIPYNAMQESISQMEMYGFIRNENNVVMISNRIFETLLYNLFLSDEELKNNIFGRTGDREKNIFVEDGRLNVRLILEHFGEIYRETAREGRFKEKDGRELFLLYLKPIINGTGNYYIEAATRDQMRTDVIVDYLGVRHIIELKIWHGAKYNQKGEQQLAQYLDSYGLGVGYLLTFNFNKTKETGMTRVSYEDKVLYEMVV